KPEARLDGVLISPMKTGGIECILGVRHDPVLGTIVMLGSGGVNVELQSDIALRIAPIDHEQAQEMVCELKIAPLFAGYRGSPPMDTNALADAIVRISQLALAMDSQLDSLEINPLLVMPQDHGVLALDAVLLTHPASSCVQTCVN